MSKETDDTVREAATRYIRNDADENPIRPRATILNTYFMVNGEEKTGPMNDEELKDALFDIVLHNNVACFDTSDADDRGNVTVTVR